MRQTPTLNESEKLECDRLIETALYEDLADGVDLTTEALVPDDACASIQIVARQPGVLSGMSVLERLLIKEFGAIELNRLREDGERLQAGAVVGILQGNLGRILTLERTILNFLTLLSGVATLTREFVDAVNGTDVKILDTRKTLPGLRSLQKFAVRCGGGSNHRFGLFDAVLIKDNHLAWWSRKDSHATLAQAVLQARTAVPRGTIIEIEVDSLEQFQAVLNGSPDIVLLDNMSLGELREAVAIRDQINREILLEASGGVTLTTVSEIAQTGVDRISVGALTHSAPALDLAFDWSSGVTSFRDSPYC